MSKVLKTVLIALLVLGVLGGTVGLISWTTSNDFDKKDISSLAFSVGGLDGTGAYMDTNTSIYTKDAFECQGLNITLDFDNMIEYKIYFYDQNNDFVHTTGTRTNAFVDTEVPFFAKYARIVVTPTEDDVVSTLEVNKYAKQINVSVNREQGFKNYTENLFKVFQTRCSIDDSTGDILTGEGYELLCVSEFINISDYDEALCISFKNANLENSHLYLYDAQKKFVSSRALNLILTDSYKTSEGYTYCNVDLSKITQEFAYIRVSVWTNDDYVICFR